MRAYFFGNMYLSSIQQGIQAAHVVGELIVKYTPIPARIRSKQWGPLMEWASDHKTMVLLNAGYSEEIRNLVHFFETEDNPYPWHFFKEGKDALDGALTCVGIILPERIYETGKICREENWAPALLQNGILGQSKGLPTDLTDWECELILKLGQYGLEK